MVHAGYRLCHLFGPGGTHILSRLLGYRHPILIHLNRLETHSRHFLSSDFLAIVPSRAFMHRIGIILLVKWLCIFTYLLTFALISALKYNH